ncbi:lysozyme inhibitor LprI family protein [Pontibaca methylaminivorans]|uniref:lysozyme inhibitor LprI family protein n=1 Tax=Pontibaca methylaminivorans TaxID=515897 RepID=UPI002FDA83D5
MPGFRAVCHTVIITLPALVPVSVAGGDASGLDPAMIDQCLASASSEGERSDCAGAGQESCLAFVAARHPDLSVIDRQLGCLDAEQQAWDTKLQSTYDALKSTEAERGNERAAALIAMERAWIAFRDSRCAYDKVTNGHGTGGILAEPTCRLRETARQTALLMSYRDDRG